MKRLNTISTQWRWEERKKNRSCSWISVTMVTSLSEIENSNLQHTVVTQPAFLNMAWRWGLQDLCRRFILQQECAVIHLHLHSKDWSVCFIMTEALQFHWCITHQVKQSPCLNSPSPERRLFLMVSALLAFFLHFHWENRPAPWYYSNNSSPVLSGTKSWGRHIADADQFRESS